MVGTLGMEGHLDMRGMMDTWLLRYQFICMNVTGRDGMDPS